MMVADRRRSGGKKNKKVRLVHLTKREEQKLKAKLLRTAPSEPWARVQIISMDDVGPDGKDIIKRYHDLTVFPPGLYQTAMVRCQHPGCERIVPPNSLEGGVCMDHTRDKVQEAYGGSPSAHAIRELQRRNERIEQRKLAPADTESLKKEIARAERRLRRKYPWTPNVNN